MARIDSSTTAPAHSAKARFVSRIPARLWHVPQLALASVTLFAGVGGVASVPQRSAPVVIAADPTIPPMRHDFERGPLHLAPAITVPIAAPAPLARARMQPREVFTFVPYWSLDLQNNFDLRGVSTLAYFGVDVSPEGSIVHSGNGWVGYRSQDLTDLITRAHRAGVRVVLTFKAFDEDTIHALTTRPAASAALARNLVSAVKAKNFDGVNIDIEGTGSAGRAPFTAFARELAGVLHAANPAWQVTLDTYITSAASSDGFFDVDALEPAVDALFVMGYDMYRADVASPNAPLPAYQSSIDAYLALVPPSKVVLGAPFYGYDWPTVDNSPHSRAAGPRTPVPYADIVAAGHPRYWDASASVPWTAYRAGEQWHEIYYDDPSSITLKARLANSKRLRGTGAWALGMNGDAAEMVAALLGALEVTAGPNGPGSVPIRPSSRPSAPPSKPATSSQPASSPSPKPSPKPSTSPKPAPSLSPLPLPLPSL